ncbi:MAG: OmpH family outer membrane protein, partial [Flavobacterium sp.]|nr:OmpH family outer membrane protein [Flavobacterium sp.]
MKKLLFLLLISSISFSQSRGIRIAYIDMEYILEKVPSYAEAKNQLEQKTVKWKQDIEDKKNEINKLKDKIKTEKAILTKE